ncbi:MAG: hypothetical protein ACJ77O_11740 [Chloroflexota bacterium]
MAAAAIDGCGSPAPSVPEAIPATLGPLVTPGPQSLDCEFLLSRAEVEQWLHARVEQVRVSYGDTAGGAGCQYQTAMGAGYVTIFTGPAAEQMWSNRPAGTPGPPGPVEINVVDGAPVGHLLGRWVTVRGQAFDGLALATRIELVELLAGRL